jgi:hypothetical protein
MLSDYDLNSTIATQWRLRLTARKPKAQMHWRTKTAYYDAVIRLLNRGAGADLTWSSVVAAVSPHGSRSTFYEVTGPASKHSLLAAYASTTRVETLQGALCFKRPSAVAQLIDETKVYSFWHLRSRYLLSPGRTVEDATEALLATLRHWAQLNPRPAAALDFSPPVCAVEDLVAIHHGLLPALRAFNRLRDILLP